MNNKLPVNTQNKINDLNNHYIVFRINNQLYGIDIQHVIEVINFPAIEISQSTPIGVIGIFNYNGIMVNVIDLCPLLGFETVPFSVNNQLIIICSKGNCFAVNTDNIINIVQFNAKNIQPIPYSLDNSIVSDICNSDGNMINIINTDIISDIINNNSSDYNKINYRNLLPSDDKSQQILNIRAKNIEKHSEFFSFPINYNSFYQFILFTLDNDFYFLDLKYIKEFISLKHLQITKLPYTKDFIKGIINHKGEFIIVLDLNKFLNDKQTVLSDNNKLIIAEGKNFNIALLVNDIKYIKTLKNINFSDYKNYNSEYISYEFTEENRLYSILNFEKIVNDEKLYINIK